MTATTVGLIALGGLIGAPARYHLDRCVRRRVPGVFPWGTLAVNVAGCLLLGILTRLTLGTPFFDLLGVGFCGALTTYSTFGYETVRLVEDGVARAAVWSVVAHVLCGLGAAWLGFTLVAAG
ncbi:MAG TPA: fluoride efflux transporter CrcB [Actinopolymorphaceae bacterium]